MAKLCLTLLSLTIVACSSTWLVQTSSAQPTQAPNTVAVSPCGDWQAYKDEKCFKIVDDNFHTFDEAARLCGQLFAKEYEPSMVEIASREEQDFLVSYLYKTVKKEENFWLGARSVGGKFRWVADNSELASGFTNWDPKGFKNHADYCVQVQADERSQGLWIDEPCDFKRNLVVCQRTQTWSIGSLAKTLVKTRKQLNDEIASLKSISADQNNRINANRNDLIPAGFLYVQLPGEKEPAALWPFLKWTEVSKAYEGVFFRVVGGGAAAFGQAQAEQAPALVQVDTVAATGVKVGNHALKPGAVTDVVSSGSSGDGKVGLVFHQSGGEIRPRNMAVRVWKRA